MFKSRIKWVLLLTGVAALAVSGCSAAGPAATTPDWFNVKLTEVKSGRSFSMSDFAGKVVLVETIVEWCSTCKGQQDEVKKMHSQMGNATDLVSVSLDTDSYEDAASLKVYSENQGYDWYFAMAPLEVERALGNLYSAEYLNPPLSPMLIIDRQGRVHGLPYGKKDADSLQKTVEAFLAQ